MNKVQINNVDELLQFIKRDEVTGKQALQIVCKALKVVCIFEMTKQEVINKTEFHINKYCKNDNVNKPIFLGQTNIEFCVTDIYNNGKN
jgi:hypothetical protein